MINVTLNVHFLWFCFRNGLWKMRSAQPQVSSMWFVTFVKSVCVKAWWIHAPNFTFADRPEQTSGRGEPMRPVIYRASRICAHWLLFGGGHGLPKAGACSPRNLARAWIVFLLHLKLFWTRLGGLPFVAHLNAEFGVLRGVTRSDCRVASGDRRGVYALRIDLKARAVTRVL